MHKINGFKDLDIVIGDVVLIKEDNVKRGQWKMGVVNDLITSKDGITRGAKVRIVKKGKPDILNRPCQKLYPLEVQSHCQKRSENLNESEEHGRKENSQAQSKHRPKHAAAIHVQWTTCLVLDSMSQGGSMLGFPLQY